MALVVILIAVAVLTQLALLARKKQARTNGSAQSGNGYVERNLIRGERVIYRATVHWLIYLPSVLAGILGIWMYNADQGTGDLMAAGFVVLFFAVYSGIKANITRVSTELAITSKRVIAKKGFIRRQTVELNHSKVESFTVDQSIMGRIFGYGTIVICGTGGGKTPIPNIDNPLGFRRVAMETIEGEVPAEPALET
ncbi:PH domain-containing protein [Proteobacteria bacterium 005FR1]|nr:PH domain-containing protein [Proteobacteria bacterium 005FR1]